MHVLILISEPWELAERFGGKPIGGKLLKLLNSELEEQALIKLDEHLTHNGASFECVVASPRHQNNLISAIKAGDKMLCAFVALPKHMAEASGELELKDWRGGLAFIGDLELVD